MDADFLIIGGGIAGISAAARMSELGSVIVLEAEDALAHHASGRSAALFEPRYGAPAVVGLSMASEDYFRSMPGVLSPRGLLLVGKADEAEAFEHDLTEMHYDRISVDEALSVIAGYSIALDMVVRGPEDRSLRKSGDSYAVLGPWLVTADEVADPQALDFFLNVNGEARQASNTGRMIMTIAEQIAYASRFYTLYPGDIIMTGTCEGVGPVTPGDIITRYALPLAAIGPVGACSRGHLETLRTYRSLRPRLQGTA